MARKNGKQHGPKEAGWRERIRELIAAVEKENPKFIAQH